MLGDKGDPVVKATARHISHRGLKAAPRCHGGGQDPHLSDLGAGGEDENVDVFSGHRPGSIRGLAKRTEILGGSWAPHGAKSTAAAGLEKRKRRRPWKARRRENSS
jgi:hypothetical protein